jgi:hypothetical protein
MSEQLVQVSGMTTTHRQPEGQGFLAAAGEGFRQDSRQLWLAIGSAGRFAPP